MEKTEKIYVAGHRGLVGSAITRHLLDEGYDRLLLQTHAELDLTCQQAVEHFFRTERPDYVFLAAAKVGGIGANNSFPADFIYQNLMMETNVIQAAYRSGVKKLLFLGSSCIYPRLCPQPIREEYLMTGPLEPTNEPYAMAKLAGISMCNAYRRQYGCNFISVMPTNLYGPGDNFDLETAHVLPALIRKFHEAKSAGRRTVTLWGSGTPRREFLYVDDLARACVFLMQQYDGAEIVNIGTGHDVTIAELAAMIGNTVEFAGEIEYDAGKPDGTPQKLLDVAKINALGWQAKVSLAEGLQRTYQWFRNATT
jgi:GDP-L-fucose synthase